MVEQLVTDSGSFQHQLPERQLARLEVVCLFIFLSFFPLFLSFF